MSDFGNISDYITGGSIKRLSQVECDPARSNQHELNGTVAMREYLGVDRAEYPATYLRLDDDETKVACSTGMLTWYDAREGNPKRSEYRFYYQDNPALGMASEGDLLAVILKKNGHILLVSTPQGSQSELILADLFHSEVGKTFNAFHFASVTEELTLSKRFLLEEIGFEIDANYGNDYLELIEKRFGALIFPKTKEFSLLAREVAGTASSFDSADDTIVRWWDTEEAMFRQLEGYMIQEKLHQGFTDSDDFLSFSQTIRQRRNSRAGNALENHIAALFDHETILYSWGACTENHKKPDFLFPSVEKYHDQLYPGEKLIMLGVKTTCKDRWRQVLTEADRIPKKHLFTLQPKISKNQTAEMQQSNLQLVIPRSIHSTFAEVQREWLWDFETFIEVVRKCQA